MAASDKPVAQEASVRSSGVIKMQSAGPACRGSDSKDMVSVLIISALIAHLVEVQTVADHKFIWALQVEHIVVSAQGAHCLIALVTSCGCGALSAASHQCGFPTAAPGIAGVAHRQCTEVGLDVHLSASCLVQQHHHLECQVDNLLCWQLGG
jgi:hypothetical protein